MKVHTSIFNYGLCSPTHVAALTDAAYIAGDVVLFVFFFVVVALTYVTLVRERWLIVTAGNLA